MAPLCRDRALENRVVSRPEPEPVIKRPRLDGADAGAAAVCGGPIAPFGASGGKRPIPIGAGASTTGGSPQFSAHMMQRLAEIQARVQ
jgi:hypothetical protein